MSSNAYSEINLHIVWRVKDNDPVIRDHVESHLHRYLKDRAVREPGVFVHAVGGADEHVHMAVSIPATLLISRWIGELKGSAGYFINHEIANRHLLEWQAGYGVVSFGSRDLPWVVKYVQDQRRHHQDGRTHDRLERIESPDAGKPGEPG